LLRSTHSGSNAFFFADIMNSRPIVRAAHLLVLSIACAAAIFAQTAPKQTPTPDDEIIKVDSQLVMIPVAVTDQQGVAVSGLTAADFRVIENGKPQVIDSVGSADKVPLDIALLFDISATTSPMFKFQAETAAKFLKDVMRPEDRACIFSIGASPRLVHPLDTAENAAAALRSIQATKEYTAFYDTVRAAAEYLKQNAPDGTRRVIVTISDGEDTNSDNIAKALQKGYAEIGRKINTIDSKELYKLTVATRDAASRKERQRVLQILQNGDTVFYSINPAGSSFQLNKISTFGQENMQAFADETGGTAFLPKFQPIDTKDNYANENNDRANTAALDRIFRQLANEVRSQYLIQYYSEIDLPPGQYVKLEVTLPSRPGLRSRSRIGYYTK